MDLILCQEPGCRRLATSYTTLEEDPWESPRRPNWYACWRHESPKHRPLPADMTQAPVCERCGRTENVRWTGGGTAYHYVPSVWDLIRYGPGGLDPNRDSPYCAECAEDYHSYWDEMWRSCQGA